MLVTCPECGVIISSEAENCPKCGFLEAGKQSKEYNESFLEYYKKHGEKLEYDSLRKCSKCGYTSIHWKIKKPELTKIGVGYAHTVDSVYCPKCGGIWTAELVDEVSSVDSHEPEALPKGWLIYFLIIIFIIISICILKHFLR